MVSLREDNTIIPNIIVLEPRLSACEFRILVYLAMWSSPRPSRWQIMDATGISEKTIDKSLKELKRLGVIDWSRGKKGKTNSYTILPAAEWDLSERDEWLGQGARAKRAFLDRKRRSTFKRGLAGSGVDLRPGEERPEDEDERKW